MDAASGTLYGTHWRIFSHYCWSVSLTLGCHVCSGSTVWGLVEGLNIDQTFMCMLRIFFLNWIHFCQIKFQDVSFQFDFGYSEATCIRDRGRSYDTFQACWQRLELTEWLDLLFYFFIFFFCVLFSKHLAVSLHAFWLAALARPVDEVLNHSEFHSSLNYKENVHFVV